MLRLSTNHHHDQDHHHHHRRETSSSLKPTTAMGDQPARTATSFTPSANSDLIRYSLANPNGSPLAPPSTYHRHPSSPPSPSHHPTLATPSEQHAPPSQPATRAPPRTRRRSMDLFTHHHPAPSELAYYPAPIDEPRPSTTPTRHHRRSTMSSLGPVRRHSHGPADPPSPYRGPLVAVPLYAEPSAFSSYPHSASSPLGIGGGSGGEYASSSTGHHAPPPAPSTSGGYAPTEDGDGSSPPPTGQAQMPSSQIGQWVCDEPGCGKIFTRSFNLRQHRLSIHMNQRRFECSMCNATFYRRNDLTRHERSHTGERPFQCQICGARFFRSDLLGRHRQRGPCARVEAGQHLHHHHHPDGPHQPGPFP